LVQVPFPTQLSQACHRPSGSLNGCPKYDAGDGSFPSDAPTDSMTFVPEGGAG
jgi:hypothetical protein